MSIYISKNIKENEPYVLPSGTKELQSFISKYKIDMMEQVISSIEFAIKNNLPTVELFQFKGSQFIVTISPPEFEENLKNIYDYYLKNEKYEFCDRIVKLLDKLNKNLNEKKKRKTTGTK
jgi:hypothetical protein